MDQHIAEPDQSRPVGRWPGGSALLGHGPSGFADDLDGAFGHETEVFVIPPGRAGLGDLSGVLRRLLAGPEEEEFAAGIWTAISPQTELRSASLDGDTAIVDLTADFVEVGGQEQTLAVAQIVLTTTSVPGVGQVRFLLEGQAVEVPRADGTLTSEALRATDYEALLRPGA